MKLAVKGLDTVKELNVYTLSNINKMHLKNYKIVLPEMRN